MEPEMPESFVAGKSTFRSRFVRTFATIALAAGVFGASAPASADFLRQTDFANGSATLTVTSPALNGSTNVGGFKGFYSATSGALLSSPLLSYCIELAQNFAFNTTYTDYSTVPVASAPNTIPGGMNTTKATNLAMLFGNGRFADSFTSTTKSVAMQLAIWEIVYETAGAAYNVTSGAFSTAASGITTQANNYLAAMGLGQAAQIAALTSPGQQDFITVVPVPPSAALLGTGLLFGLWTMRRRRSQA
jgi:hypothetical protein